jgi:hypothetical protein
MTELVAFVIASDLSAVARRAKAEAKQSGNLSPREGLDCFGPVRLAMTQGFTL